MNNAAFWIRVEKPEAPCTVNCNLESLNPWKNFILSCSIFLCEWFFHVTKAVNDINFTYHIATLRGSHGGTVHRLGSIHLYSHNSHAKLQGLYACYEIGFLLPWQKFLICPSLIMCLTETCRPFERIPLYTFPGHNRMKSRSEICIWRKKKWLFDSSFLMLIFQTLGFYEFVPRRTSYITINQ